MRPQQREDSSSKLQWIEWVISSVGRAVDF